MAMNLFGFTIIRSSKLRELERELEVEKKACASLRMKRVRDMVRSASDIEEALRNNDQELRKWCFVHSGSRLSVGTGLMYRYIKTGDESVLTNYRKYCDLLLKEEKENAKTDIVEEKVWNCEDTIN